MIRNIISFTAILLLAGCGTDDSSQMDNQLTVTWKVNEQLFSPDRYNAEFIFKNETGVTLKNSNWSLHFNQIVAENIENKEFSIQRISGNYFKLTPNKSFEKIRNGEEVILSYEMPGQFKRKSFEPLGVFLVLDEERIIEVKDYSTEIFPNGMPEEFLSDSSFITPERLYDKYSINNQSPTVYDSTFIVPSPMEFTTAGGVIELDSVNISYDEALKNEANKLGSLISLIFQGTVNLVESDKSNINIVLNDSLESDHYRVKITNESIQISGGGPKGVFYGIQTLIQLGKAIGTDKSSLTFPIADIRDNPRFPYRGLMIDVARNFQTKENIFRMLDIMAFFKLNKLHFHLTNDEGWRLEINKLPELTAIGSKRGYTVDELNNLYPSYGSGPDPEEYSSTGNGYYTREDFIEILQYASKNHIEVIPEITMPGHARAAIKAMEARYEKYKDINTETAEEYLLSDPNDKSEYMSVQYYTDNTVCVCRESVYNFIETVVDEVISMYTEAEAPLKLIHTGGDEVPNGVWEGSPICQEFAKAEGLDLSKSTLSEYFIERINKIISSKNLVTGGWEEVSLTAKNGEDVPNKNLIDSRIVPYVWHTKHAYELPNEGYKVVLCNAEYVYFDLAYQNDIFEPGLSWAGYVGMKEPYIFKPMELDSEVSVAKGENILGIQGELWGETIKGINNLSYYALPKLLSMSETAWTQEGNKIKYRDYAANAYRTTLPLITQIDDEINFRVPKPGIKITDNKVYMNSEYPEMEIRYTLDGSEPDIGSPAYSEPFELGNTEIIKAKAFYLGRKSLLSRAIVN